LFGFFLGGITAVAYEELYGKYFAKRHIRAHRWHLLVAPFGVLFIIIFCNNQVFGINSIYASMIYFVLMWAVMIAFRHDLVLDSIASGLIVGTGMFAGYMVFLTLFPEAIQRWWEIKNITGTFVHGVPIEELLWAFTWGLIGGPMYEFFAGLRFVDR
jgi:hypothetical protein